MALILCFGDSIVQGYADTKGGWVQHLRNYLSEKEINEGGEYYEVQNLGLSRGETTDDLIKRIEPEARARVSENEVITLISIGINDSGLMKEKNENWVSKEKYRNNLQEIIKKATVFSSRVVLLGITPVNESRTKPISWDKRISYFNSTIFEYNEAMKDLAAENNIQFINLIPELKKVSWEKMLYDGVHPNDEGHKLIFEVVRDRVFGGV